MRLATNKMLYSFSKTSKTASGLTLANVYVTRIALKAARMWPSVTGKKREPTMFHTTPDGGHFPLWAGLHGYPVSVITAAELLEGSEELGEET